MAEKARRGICERRSRLPPGSRAVAAYPDYVAGSLYPNGVIDGEWEHITPPYYTYGFAYQGMNPQTFVPAPPVPSNLNAAFPADQVLVTVQQYYFDADRNPLSGFLTFWPSSGFTIEENGTSWYVPQRLCGTQTWPGVQTGQSPWAWSMDTTGKIYIWLGLMSAILYATDNPSIVTDDGGQLVYHVAEHFTGGREYEIQVPQALAGDLTSCVIPETIRPHKFDPLYPMGVMGKRLKARRRERWRKWMSILDTEYLTFDIRALGIRGLTVNPTSDLVYVAFMENGALPQPSDWQQAGWVSGQQPYQIEFLVGPSSGAHSLAAGQYRVWLMIVDNPAVPVRPIGYLYITQPQSNPQPPLFPWDTGDE